MLPNWDLAEQALSILDTLDLNDNETKAWQYSLKLQMAQAHLSESEDLDYAFSLFEEIKSEPGWQAMVVLVRKPVARLVFRLIMGNSANSPCQIDSMSGSSGTSWTLSQVPLRFVRGS